LARTRGHIHLKPPVRFLASTPQSDHSSCILTPRDRYASALQSLSHVLVLTPQNPFYVLQAAETAYTAQDITLAMKFFLMVIDMADDGNDDGVHPPPPKGFTLRAWYGVELVSSSLPRHHAFREDAMAKTKTLTFPSIVGCAPRGRFKARRVLAVQDAPTRTPVAATGAGAGRDQIGALWRRRRVRSVPDMAKPEIVNPYSCCRSCDAVWLCSAHRWGILFKVSLVGIKIH
jgi:hypothetical protein